MIKLKTEDIVREIDSVHRELGLLALEQRSGTRTALKTEDVYEAHSLPMRPESVTFLRARIAEETDPREIARLERVLYACMDLTMDQETASLADMLTFYAEGGRMIVNGEKIPFLEIVPWIQQETDYERREIMKKECTIYLRGIINPILQGYLELTAKAAVEKFGFADLADYAQSKKDVSFADSATAYEDYLQRTDDAYARLLEPWVESKIGRPLDGMSRYHALYLIRIRRFDEYFRPENLERLALESFRGLGFDMARRGDVTLDVKSDPARNPDGICIGIDIPGNVHVLMKPVGGLIDVETILHETGHAFFLSNMDENLPLEFRRLYRSAALDETFAFLFMDLIDNPAWLERFTDLNGTQIADLRHVYSAKRLCLIRRHIGKFLAEKDLHESGTIKNTEPYCRRLHRATRFSYEPEGYLIDMDADFYALEYVRAWSGANVLRAYLEREYGEEWFGVPAAGAFLRQIAAGGRELSVEKVCRQYCGEPPRLPEFAED